MIRETIVKNLEQAAVQAQQQGLIPQVDLPDIVLEHPQNPEHGDYAATIAMKLAKAARMNPFNIAEYQRWSLIFGESSDETQCKCLIVQQ